MEKKATAIAGDRSAALRHVEEVNTLSEGGTIVTRVGPESKANSALASLDFPIVVVVVLILQAIGLSISSWKGFVMMILIAFVICAGFLALYGGLERFRLDSRWSDAMTSFLVRRGAENVVPGLVGKAPDGTLSQTTTYTVEGRKMVAVLTGAPDGSPTTIKVGLASADQQEDR